MAVQGFAEAEGLKLAAEYVEAENGKRSDALNPVRSSPPGGSAPRTLPGGGGQTPALSPPGRCSLTG
jgi:hypothetical protein